MTNPPDIYKPLAQSRIDADYLLRKQGLRVNRVMKYTFGNDDENNIIE